MQKSIFVCLISLLSAVLFTACSTGVPKNITPVTEFEPERYLGTWYEIARLDHRFERGLQNVTAHYTKRDDGGIRVLNKGYNIKTSKWTEAEGKAYFVAGETTGHLKVSFFGPFYGSYVIFQLDPEFTLSYVSGPNKNYLWFLSRRPYVSQAEKDAFVSTISGLGYDADALIWVDQKDPKSRDNSVDHN